MSVPDRRYSERRNRLREAISLNGLAERLVVTDLPNIRYLSGFSGSNAVLVVGADPMGDLIGTDGRYVDQVSAQCPDLPTVIDRDTLKAVMRALTSGPYLVESSLGIGDVQQLTADVGAPLVAGSLVEELRMVKDVDERALLQRAGEVTAAAFTCLHGELRAGMTEVAVARRLEQIFGEMGAEDRAFDTIVASGPHSAIPHHEPTMRPLEVGDLVVIDAGARVEGYHADMTRTWVVGADPAPWQVELHGLVEAARAAAASAYRPGAQARDVDAVARDLITEGGMADHFTHGLGHGVGLQIHEAPMVGARSTGTIGSDMAITVEPGIYLPGRGGVRIEDTLVVTDSGPRCLTEAPRGLVVVG